MQEAQQRCIVTIDQPPFIKAMDIVSQDEIDDLTKVIVRLGRFHLLMSYMGAVGKVMGGSGLEEMGYKVFAKNAIVWPLMDILMQNHYELIRFLRQQ
ncbi:hypothetical protein AVEN_132016-1 [Araneus ventricosus]|uniref:Uncharacterized protein n=1 Tax=Araneus ventricosus TaxID=182803 RepID=A0A4Y2B4R0_ARAVE|nr:hypothetical protein AVEN_132016-1 [Araneus ventricosus]